MAPKTSRPPFAPCGRIIEGTGRVGQGLNHLIAGVAAALVLPALVFGLGIGFVYALGIAAVTYVALWLTLGPNVLPGSRSRLAEQLVADAAPARDRLAAAARAIENKTLKAIVSRLAALTSEIGEKLLAKPETIGRVSRFFTYYLPQAAAFADGYRALESLHVKDQPRMQETEELLTKLEQAFRRYADDIIGSELDHLDVEMKLLRQSLESDLGKLPELAPPQPVKAAVPRVGSLWRS